LSLELDRLDYVVYGKIIDERRARLVIWGPLGLANLAHYTRRLRGKQGLPAALTEGVIPRQDALALAADAPGVRRLTAENAGPRQQHVLELYHGLGVCAGAQPKTARLFAPFAAITLWPYALAHEQDSSSPGVS
jgi:hypothetical protein